MKKFRLVIDELHFDGAHYLTPEFGPCQYLHGHRWHVRDLVVTETKIVDFAEIRKVVDGFDHRLIIPQKDEEVWISVKNKLPCGLRVKAIPYPLSLVEFIKDTLKEELEGIDGVESISFSLYETDNAGVLSE